MQLLAYPAQITAPGGVEHRPVKVYRDTEAGQLVAFGVAGREIVEVARVTLADVPRATSARTWEAIDVDGQEWTVARTGGCGCSHPLKRFQPDSQPRRVGT